LEDEVDRAEYMARLLDECGSYADAVLVAFVRGNYSIAKDRLERAYEQSLGSVLRWIHKRAGPTTSIAEVPLTVGWKVGRYLAKEKPFSLIRVRVQHLGQVHRNAPVYRVMHDLATDLITLMLVGENDLERTSHAALTVETLVGDGSLSDAEPERPPSQPAGGSFAELASQLDLKGLVRIVRSASMKELESARDAAKTFRAFAHAYGRVAERRSGTARAFIWLVVGTASDTAVAYAIPALVVIRRLHGDRLDELVAFMGAWTPFFAAANAVLDELPPELQVLARPNGYESLNPDERQQLAQHLERLETTRPIALKLTMNPPAVPDILG
jgi:hypothetical protein